MKINGKAIKTNEFLTFGQLEYLEKRYDSLESQIEKRFPVTCSFEKSRASEAAYFDVENENEESFSFSIRNHTNKYSNADKFFWLGSFENWNELKKDIFASIETFLKEGE